jgi:signal transduction histidine kinase
VSVNVAREGSRVRLAVTDTGPGIPAADLPHVFDRFYRADKARSREQGGTGLGLAIAHWIVERHNGHIAVKSIVGVGTEVSVDLPGLSADEAIEDTVFQNPTSGETVETAKRTSEAEGPSTL